MIDSLGFLTFFMVDSCIFLLEIIPIEVFLVSSSIANFWAER